MADLPAGFRPVTEIPSGFAPVLVKSTAPKATPKGDTHGVVSGAVLDTLGLTDRPGAVPLTGTATTKTPLGVVLKPEGLGEAAVREAVLAPATATSLPGRLAISAGLGAAEQLASGKGLGEAGYAALLDAVTAGTFEAALGVGGAVAKKVAKPLLEAREVAAGAQRAFEWATAAPGEALAALRSRFPGARVLIPSIDKTAKITLDAAAERLSALTGNAYKQARAEIADWMNRLDKQRTPKPRAGSVFKEFTSKERYPPRAMPSGTPQQRAASAVADVAGAPVVRGAVDVAATTPMDEEGTPVGLVPASALAGAAVGGAHSLSKALGLLFQR